MINGESPTPADNASGTTARRAWRFRLVAWTVVTTLLLFTAWIVNFPGGSVFRVWNDARAGQKFLRALASADEIVVDGRFVSATQPRRIEIKQAFQAPVAIERISATLKQDKGKVDWFRSLGNYECACAVSGSLTARHGTKEQTIYFHGHGFLYGQAAIEYEQSTPFQQLYPVLRDGGFLAIDDAAP